MSEFNLQNALAAIAQRRAENGTETELVNVHIDPNSPRERIARARQFEQGIIGQVEWLQTQPDSDLKTQRMNAFMDRLGELAAEQGDYVRAVEVSYSPERREHYQKVVDAIGQPNTEHCDCPPDVETDIAHRKEFQSPAMMHAATIVSKDGNLLNLQVCRKCGFMQAK